MAVTDGVELPDEAGGGIARVGEDLEPLLGLLRVEALKIGMAHVDLAAHLEGGGKILGRNGFGNVADGSHIGGDVFALVAVAARRTLDQPATLVTERDREPVDLRLGRDLKGLFRGKSEKRLGADEKCIDLVFGESVVDRQHRHAMRNLAERPDRGGANAQGWAVVADQMGKARLDLIVTRP